MRTVGIVTTGVLGVVGLIAIIVGIMSIPDVKRYLKIRQM
ncbi:hypothetical protein BH18ACT9_BH18ACT9_01910 [soil metagenome]